MMWWIFWALVAWLLFNWLAPLSLLAFAEPMSIGRIPRETLEKANAYHVRYYVAKLTRGYAFSTWLGWRHAVVINRDFLREGMPTQIRFVLAHELGHCALGHLRHRWLMVVTGLILLPAVQRSLARKEDEADRFAEKLSGLPKSVLFNWRIGDVRPSEIARASLGGMCRHPKCKCLGSDKDPCPLSL